MKMDTKRTSSREAQKGRQSQETSVPILPLSLLRLSTVGEFIRHGLPGMQLLISKPNKSIYMPGGHC